MRKVNEYISDYFKEGAGVIASLDDEKDNVIKISKLIFDNHLDGRKLLVAGNGGSCADAEHFAGEMLCTFKNREREAISAVSLTNNASAITAWANDFNFTSYFSRQVEALGRRGDVLFLISTGGGNRENGASMNLVYAAERAKDMEMKVISLSGKGGGILSEISDICITVKSDVTSLIQEAHISLIHGICLCIDALAEQQGN